MSDLTPGLSALRFIAEHYPRLHGYVEANDALRGTVVGALGSVIGDWWDHEGYDCPETSKRHLCDSFQRLIEEDYLASEVIPQTLQAPPEITDPVISDILLPVRDEEEWKRDCELMDTLKRMSEDPVSSAKMRADTARLYELALVGWSCTFYRKGE